MLRSATNLVCLRRAAGRPRECSARAAGTIRQVGYNEGNSAALATGGNGSLGAVAEEMRDAVELLAKVWPEDYRAGALERLIAA
jgi:hypothetical protein